MFCCLYFASACMCEPIKVYARLYVLGLGGMPNIVQAEVYNHIKKTRIDVVAPSCLLCGSLFQFVWFLFVFGSFASLVEDGLLSFCFP